MFCRQLSALVCVTALLVAGCSRKTDDATPPPGDAQTPVASAPADAPATTLPSEAGPAAAPAVGSDTNEAESGLSIKRGVAKFAGDHVLFRPCDEQADLWLIDEGDAMLAQLFAEGMKTAYVEVYGERAPVPDDLPAARNHAGVFVLEQLLYAGAPSDNGGCVPAAADAIVTARGNEPFWTAQVTETKATWQQQDPTLEIKLDTVQSQDVEGTVSYRAKADGHELELVIDAQPCRDLVSEEFFAFAARAKLDDKEFKGCARVGK
jgi:uncharacterized membrane protein